MRVAGQAVLHAPIDRVWAALNDPAVLERTIPGCERLEATGPDAYAMVVTAGVAAIKGTYAGQVALSGQQQPTSFVMRASGAGAPGTVSADVTVTLAAEGELTRLSYDAEAVVGGVIGGVGQRMLTAVAKKLAGEFFDQVDDVLTGRAAVVARGFAAASGVSSTAGPAAGPAGAVVPTAAGRATMPSGTERSFLLGTLTGAAIALLGVLVGVRAGRRGSAGRSVG
jgi:hypothetical protein